MIVTTALTREEQLILSAARAAVGVEHPESLASTLEQGVVWRGVEFLAERNNVGSLMHRALRNLPDQLVPEQVQAKFRQSYLATYQRNQEFGSVIADIQKALCRSRTKAVFLRGLVLAELVYGNPSLRRFADIDLLVTRDDVDRALGAIESIGGVPRNGTLGNGYYLRNHFHLERVLDRGKGATVELHWNLDHRYTMFTIDVSGLIERSHRAELCSSRLNVLDPVDDLLGLCLHAVKHCPAVRYFPTSPLLARRILLDGWLTQILDIAMALRRYEAVDWERLEARARSWGLEAAAGGAFCAVSTMLGVAPPSPVLGRLHVPPRSGRLERAVVRTFLDPTRTLQPFERRGALMRFILRRWRFQEDAVFHPVRLLDLLDYFFPRREDLARWMGRPRLRPYGWWWFRHAATNSARLLAGLVDLVVSRATSRLRRVRAEGRGTRA